ncbi:hypothetical protein RDABS01_026562 [Bienertia sinuspersici]
MEDIRCSPHDCTFNTIIGGFLDGKDIKRVLEYVSMMRSKDFMSDNHTISSLVDFRLIHLLVMQTSFCSEFLFGFEL